MKKLISIILLATVLSSIFAGAIVAEPTTTELNKTALNWDQKSIIDKQDWIINAEKPVTRIEFATVIDNIMDLQGQSQNSYTDLANQNQKETMLKIEKANLLVGTDNTIRPDEEMTKEEAIVVFAKALGLKVNFNETQSKFTDNDAITKTAIPYIRAMKDLNNLPFKDTFSPQEKITKAQLLQTIDMSISDVASEDKITDQTISNTLVLNKANTIVENVTIEENLIIAEGVSSGQITLNNVKVKGQTVIRGGQTIDISSSQLSSILVENRDLSTHLNIDETSTPSTVKVVEAKDGVEIQGKISVATLHNPKGNFTLTNGVADRIETESEEKIIIDKNSKAQIINLSTSGSKVEIAGTAESVYAGEKANNTEITVLEGGIINTLTKRTDSIINSKGSITNTIELPKYEQEETTIISKAKAASQTNNTSTTGAETFLGSFTSTAYCTENYHHICNDGNPSKTALGTAPIPYKTIAVDPKVIKLGTKLKIQDASGNIYYVTATDTGGAIKGKKIDMVVDTHKNALNWGRKTVKIWTIS